MITIEKMVFNPFQVNTYFVYDETKECVIIDSACYEEDEQAALKNYVEKMGLKPVALVNTHCHVDHILGNKFASEAFGLPLQAHPDGVPFIEAAPQHGLTFGFNVVDPILPKVELHEGDQIKFGNSSLDVIEAPGHADGSICLYNKEAGILVTGDVLFKESIGRTDLPTGNLDTLLSNIKEKLFVLDGETKVFPGHGPESTIGHEKAKNPFIM